MRPRTTQESYRPRVSNRIMVGSFSKANTSACVASRTEGVEPPSQHETKWRQSIQLPWSCSRSDTARRQPSEQSTSGWMQAKQPPLSGEQGRIFILTSPLIGFLDDQRVEGLARRLDQVVDIVVRMLEADQTGHFL